MRALDLFTGTGGTGHGLALAGFQVVGIDVKRRRHRSPLVEFVQADVRDVLADLAYLRRFDLITAGPPCQVFTRAGHLRTAQGKTTSKVNMIPETRAALDAAGVPYIIENVPGAPIRPDVMLCGSMFPELAVTDATGRRWLQRHRIFELGFWPAPLSPECAHRAAGVRPLGVYASKADNIPSGGQTARTLEEGRLLMGMPWASWSGLVEAIPPAYSRWLARAWFAHEPTLADLIEIPGHL